MLRYLNEKKASKKMHTAKTNKRNKEGEALFNLFYMREMLQNIPPAQHPSDWISV